MAYKAAIFDLDGTLLNTLDDLVTSVNLALEAYQLPERSADEVRLALGNGYRRLIHESVPAGTDKMTENAVLDTFQKEYAAHAIEKTAPYAGIEGVLMTLAEKGVYRAVVSNKGDARVQELVSEFFAGRFNAVAGEREGVRRKPCPDSVNAVLAELDLEPADVVYVGDSEVDIETAKNAGCDCVIVSWGYRSREDLEAAGATSIVDTMDELEAALLA